jgi:uncharacterized protein YgiM (DUF1202 family)
LLNLKMLPMKKLVFLLTFMLLILAACNGASDDPVVQELPTSTVQPVPSQTQRVTATIRPTNTPMPTFTYTPTLTLVPPTETNTPTPSITPTVGGIISAQQPINVRTGPSTDYDILVALPAGTGVQVIGQSPDGEWFNIRIEDGREGWIKSSFVRVEPTPTVMPSITPSPNLTALFLGTPLAPTALIGGQATATPPQQLRTGTPEVIETLPPIQTEGALPGVPTIDNNAIYLTATALSGGLVNPTQRPTTEGQATSDRAITVVPSDFTPPPNSTIATAATAAPQPSATLGTGRSVRVFAFCDNKDYGAITTVPVLRAGDVVKLYWGWIASTEAQINDHLDASNLELRLNGEVINGANDMHGATQPFGSSFIVYWEVPIGPLTSGEYVVTYQVTWDRAIYDGSDFYGPETSNPFEQESCTFTIP